MPIQFQKATKAGAKLRLNLVGPAGSGKTLTALKVARAIAGKGSVALIDTEHGSASKYADTFDFDVVELDHFDPRLYVQAVEAAVEARYDVLVIDSISHEWVGKGGALEMVDSKKGNNKFSAWGEVTPLHNEFVDAIVRAPLHVIATTRSKMSYAMQEVEDNGKKRTVVERLGMAPVQRDGVEYEFDVIGELDTAHTLTVTKTRAPQLDGAVIEKPGEDFAEALLEWLKGEPVPDTLRKRFHATGSKAYGKDWDAKRADLVRHITRGRTGSSSDLTEREMQRLLDGMERKLEAESEPMIAPGSAQANGTEEPAEKATKGDGLPF